MDKPVSLQFGPDRRPSPHLVNYHLTCEKFDWNRERVKLEPAEGRIGNLGYLASGLHVQEGRGGKTAIIWRGPGNTRIEISYDEVEEQSNRFANILSSLGIGKGSTVGYLSGKIPDLFAVIIGSLKNLSMFCPLFGSFGPEPLAHRLRQGNAAALVTTTRQYENKLREMMEGLPDLQHILLVDADEHRGGDIWSLPKLLAEANSSWKIPKTSGHDPALLHFTSGTTALPKGAVIPHDAAVCQAVTGRYVLDLHDSDVFWCTADPGWVTGTTYTVLAPLILGVTTLLDYEEFSVSRWFEIMASEKVNVLYTSPTAIRRLQRVDDSTWATLTFPHLRGVHSVGEPLDTGAVLWGQKFLRQPILDSWWQTETGAIMIANYPGLTIRPGSMGRPVPGIKACILDQKTYRQLPANRTGILAIKSGWPSQFVAYVNEQARYEKCFSKGWYLTGDLAAADEDGYFWFKGRADDMIKSAGHLVGPFEVETVLNSYPEVAESAVFGIPDPLIGQSVAAVVVTRNPSISAAQLSDSLIGFARSRLGSAVAPRQIKVVDKLLKNRSGKIMRRVMRAQWLGLPEGDISTLEDADENADNR